MKEIVVLASLLGVVFVVFWCIITCLEFFIKRNKEKRGKGERKEEGEHEEMVPVIVASIAAYEEEEGERRKKRERYQIKGEGISWWKVSGRAK